MIQSIIFTFCLNLYLARSEPLINEDSRIKSSFEDSNGNSSDASMKTIPTNDSFDITYINLEKNKERNRHMREMLNFINCKYNRFNAVSGIDVFYNRTRKIEEYFPKGFNGPIGFDIDKMFYRITDSGTLGCKMSHYLLVKALSMKANAKPLLILEDDLDINFDFVKKVSQTLKKMPKEWDILLLTAFYDTKTKSTLKLESGLRHVDYFFECLAYIINGDKAAKKLINEIETSEHLKPIDIIFGDMSKNNKIVTIALDPHIAIQRRDIFGSDIANSESLIPVYIENSLMEAKEGFKRFLKLNSI